jgi:hypothetical protein
VEATAYFSGLLYRSEYVVEPKSKVCTESRNWVGEVL